MNRMKKISSSNWIGCNTVFLLYLTVLLSGCSSTDGHTSLLSQPGIVITRVLAGIVLMVASVIVIVRLNSLLNVLFKRQARRSVDDLKSEIINMEKGEIDALLSSREQAWQFRLKGEELSGANPT